MSEFKIICMACGFDAEIKKEINEFNSYPIHAVECTNCDERILLT